MNTRIPCVLVAFISLLTVSCASQTNETYSNFPYDINNADKSYILPNKLREISGLAYAGKNKIYCVQDEDGLAFLYNLKKGAVTRKIHFAKDNDYEGIAIAGKALYVLKNNGTVYKVNNFAKDKKAETTKYTTYLNESCDAEGLCYDRENERLLIACKGSAGKGKKLKNKKALYSFDLKSHKLNKKPAYLIDIKDIQEFKGAGSTQKSYDNLLSYMGDNNITFNPSAIGIHPIEKDLFMLSAQGNTLLVISGAGIIKHAVHLKSSKFRQPEGITFDDKGTMYISSEGQGGKAKIKVFSYKPKPLTDE